MWSTAWNIMFRRYLFQCPGMKGILYPLPWAFEQLMLCPQTLLLGTMLSLEM